jgi:ribosome-associated translation inhibitor RaiA
MTQKQIEETFKSSFGVDASVPDPVGGDRAAAAHRSADRTEGELTMPTLSKSEFVTKVAKLADTLSGPQLDACYKHFEDLGKGGDATLAHNLATLKSGDKTGTSAPMPTLKKVKEDIDAIFDGQTLTEEFRERATTIFEAAVHAKSIEFQAQLEEQFAADLQEAITEAVADMSEQVNKYLNHVAEQWLEENKLAVETGIKSDILESFLGGMKTLFTEHYIEIPEDKVQVVESLTAKVEELETKLNESENRFIDQQNQIAEMALTAQKEAAFKEVSEGLTDTQVDKLNTLAESIAFTTVEDYKEKLKTIVEGYVKKPAAAASTATTLNEEVIVEGAATVTQPAANKSVDPMIASFLERNKGKSAK